MTQEYKHIPVLHDEVLEEIKPLPGNIYIDCTMGGGGHGLEIARRIAPEGILIGVMLFH